MPWLNPSIIYWNRAMKNSYQASCLCGAVEVEIRGQISDIIHCHCSKCRKNSGTAYATNGFVKSADFVIKKNQDSEGQTALNSFEMAPGKKRHFCKICACPVYSSNAADPTRIRFRLGLLDSEIEERPLSHNFVSSKASWDSFDKSLIEYDAHEPSRSSD